MKYVALVLVIIGMLTAAVYWLQPQLFRQYSFSIARNPFPMERKNNQVSQDINVVARGLSIPWSIAFLPDGTMLASERNGSLTHISEGVKRITVEGVHGQGEGGLLGIALHPDFEVNRWLYLYMTGVEAIEQSWERNRVVRYVYENGALRNPKTIIDGIPAAEYHDGGAMAFGQDGYLYITTGDASVGTNAQDKDSLSGKILRVTDEGEVPADNPFGNAVYSYGHRNPQGLAWDAQGRLWSTEHGRSGIRSGFDELNLIAKGGNYGWPLIQGDETREDMITPVLHSGASDTWAPASLAYHKGKLFWGGLRGESLYEVTIVEDEVKDLRAHFHGEYGRIRAVTLGPDARLYFSTSNTDGRGMPRAGDDLIVSVNPSIF